MVSLLDSSIAPSLPHVPPLLYCPRVVFPALRCSHPRLLCSLRSARGGVPAVPSPVPNAATGRVRRVGLGRAPRRVARGGPHRHRAPAVPRDAGCVGAWIRVLPCMLSSDGMLPVAGWQCLVCGGHPSSASAALPHPPASGTVRWNTFTEGWRVVPHGPDSQHSRVTYVARFDSAGAVPPADLPTVVHGMGALIASLAQVPLRRWRLQSNAADCITPTHTHLQPNAADCNAPALTSSCLPCPPRGPPPPRLNVVHERARWLCASAAPFRERARLLCAVVSLFRRWPGTTVVCPRAWPRWTTLRRDQGLTLRVRVQAPVCAAAASAVWC
jgi:hypothetical protein